MGSHVTSEGKKPPEIELRPDCRERFERALDFLWYTSCLWGSVIV